ncbi:hypothetical protein TNCV_1348781 [Trichonephila clavipes]|nr:hypothetical protein TNCV_1348781 [Trichonephila clavipes]
MIPAYNKKRRTAFPFETGIYFRRNTDLFPEADTTKSYSGFETEPTRLQCEGHSHYTGWATLLACIVTRGATCAVTYTYSTITLESLPKPGVSTLCDSKYLRYFQLGTPTLQTADNSTT